MLRAVGFETTCLLLLAEPFFVPVPEAADLLLLAELFPLLFVAEVGFPLAGCFFVAADDPPAVVCAVTLAVPPKASTAPTAIATCNLVQPLNIASLCTKPILPL